MNYPLEKPFYAHAIEKIRPNLFPGKQRKRDPKKNGKFKLNGGRAGRGQPEAEMCTLRQHTAPRAENNKIVCT